MPKKISKRHTSLFKHFSRNFNIQVPVLV